MKGGRTPKHFLSKYREELQFLRYTTPYRRREFLLNGANEELIKFLVNSALNVLKGNININKTLKGKLIPFKTKIRKLNKGVKTTRAYRKRLSQTGGIIPLLIPAIIAALGGVVSTVVPSVIEATT
jgi:hypothetical protein